MIQEGFKRKLTSIFSADAIGYRRLMGNDEPETVRTLTSCHNVISSHQATQMLSVFVCAHCQITDTSNLIER